MSFGLMTLTTAFALVGMLAILAAAVDPRRAVMRCRRRVEEKPELRTSRGGLSARLRASDHGGSPLWRLGEESEWRPLLAFTVRPSSLYGSRWRALMWGLLCLLVAAGTIAVSSMTGLVGPAK